MKPYIEVISRQQAESLTNEDITEKTVIVSISSIGDKKTKYYRNRKYSRYFIFAF